MNNTQEPGMTYGYIRVSSIGQHDDRQYIAMRRFGVPEENIYSDKLSGKNFERPGYREVVERLRENDTLVIKSFDRLGRNFEELLEQWRYITVEKQAGIIVLDMPGIDFSGGNTLVGKFIAQNMLILMSFLAEQERVTTRERQAEGIAAARLRGVRFGRPAKEIAADFEPVYLSWAQGHLSAVKAAKLLGVSDHTFKKWAVNRQKSC